MHDEAIKCYDMAIETGEGVAYNHKGSLLEDMDMYDEAIKCYDMAIETDPGDNITYYNKGESAR